MAANLAVFELSLNPNLAAFEGDGESRTPNPLPNNGPPSVPQQQKPQEVFDLFHQEEGLDKLTKERKFVIKFQMTVIAGKCEGEFEIKSKEDENDDRFSKWSIRVLDDEAVTLKLIDKSEDINCMICGCMSAINFAFEHENYNSERYIKNRRFIVNQSLLLEKFNFPIDELLVALIINHEVGEEAAVTREDDREEMLLLQLLQERLDTPRSILRCPATPLDSGYKVNPSPMMQTNQLPPPPSMNVEQGQRTMAGQTAEMAVQDKNGFENRSYNTAQSMEKNARLLARGYLDSIGKQHDSFLSTIHHETVEPSNAKEYLRQKTMNGGGEARPPSPACHMIGNELYVTYKVALPGSLQEQNLQVEKDTNLGEDSSQMRNLFPSQAFSEVQSGQLPQNRPEFMDCRELLTPNVVLDSQEAETISYSYDKPLLVLPTVTSNEECNEIINSSIISVDDQFGSDIPCTFATVDTVSAPAFAIFDNNVADSNQPTGEDLQGRTSDGNLVTPSNTTNEAQIEMVNMGYDGVDFLAVTSMLRNRVPAVQNNSGQMPSFMGPKQTTVQTTVASTNQQVTSEKTLSYRPITSTNWLTRRQQLKQGPTKAMLSSDSGNEINIRHQGYSAKYNYSQTKTQLPNTAATAVNGKKVSQNEAATTQASNTRLLQFMNDPENFIIEEEDYEPPPLLEPQVLIEPEPFFEVLHESVQERQETTQILADDAALPLGSPIARRFRLNRVRFKQKLKGNQIIVKKKRKPRSKQRIGPKRLHGRGSILDFFVRKIPKRTQPLRIISEFLPPIQDAEEEIATELGPSQTRTSSVVPELFPPIQTAGEDVVATMLGPKRYRKRRARLIITDFPPPTQNVEEDIATEVGPRQTQTNSVVPELPPPTENVEEDIAAELGPRRTQTSSVVPELPPPIQNAEEDVTPVLDPKHKQQTRTSSVVPELPPPVQNAEEDVAPVLGPKRKRRGRARMAISEIPSPTQNVEEDVAPVLGPKRKRRGRPRLAVPELPPPSRNAEDDDVASELGPGQIQPLTDASELPPPAQNAEDNVITELDFRRTRTRSIAAQPPRRTQNAEEEVIVIDDESDKDNDNNSDPDYVPDQDEDDNDPDYQVGGKGPTKTARRGRPPKTAQKGPPKTARRGRPPKTAQKGPPKIDRRKNLRICPSPVISHEQVPEEGPKKRKYKLNKPLKKLVKEKLIQPSNLFLEQFEKQEFCDYELLCQGKTLKVHRFVLSQASKAFKSMRHYERKVPRTQVKVYCCTYEVLYEMVRYCYTLTFPPEKHAMGLFQAAAAYCIPSLKDWAADILLRQITVENACEVLVLGTDFEEERLVEGAHKTITAYPTEIVKTRGFQLISIRYPDLLKELFVSLAKGSVQSAARVSEVEGEGVQEGCAAPTEGSAT